VSAGYHPQFARALLLTGAQIQHPAPDFTAEAALPDGSIGEISLADYRSQYVVLFFYPLDFTFVCPTEIYAFADRIEEFEQRDCAVLGISVDSVHAHLAWRRMPRSEGGIGETSFPLISDLDKSIARAHGVLLDQPVVALRGVFIIDRREIVRSMQANDLPLGATSTRSCGCSTPRSSTSSTARSAPPTGSAARRA
jgi:alkyl hydroperoxide reductase subunit AhpC